MEVQVFDTDGAAWLAGARVAANGGPADLEVKRTRVDGRTVYRLLAANPADAARARSILAQFSKES